MSIIVANVTHCSTHQSNHNLSITENKVKQNEHGEKIANFNKPVLRTTLDNFIFLILNNDLTRYPYLINMKKTNNTQKGNSLHDQEPHEEEAAS